MQLLMMLKIDTVHQILYWYYKAACILLGYVEENDREFIIARGRGRTKTARGALTR